MKYFKKIWSWLPKKTPRNTIMWVQVPMTCNNRQDKDDVIMSTINHFGTNN